MKDTEIKNTGSENNIAPEIASDATLDETQKKASENTEFSTSREDNLELSQLSRKERRLAKQAKLKENMEGMSKKEKFAYLFYYYKWKVIVILLIIFVCIAVPVTLYKKSRPVAISYALLNCTATNSNDEAQFAAYKNYYSFKKSDQIITSAFTGLDADTYEEDYSRNSNSPNFTQLPMLCYNGYFDIVIGDKKAIDYCASQSLIQPLEGALLPDVYQAIENEQSAYIYSTKSNADKTFEYAIDISNTEFGKALNLGFDKIYVGFPAIEDQNYKNSRLFLNYIFNLGIQN